MGIFGSTEMADDLGERCAALQARVWELEVEMQRRGILIEESCVLDGAGLVCRHCGADIEAEGEYDGALARVEHALHRPQCEAFENGKLRWGDPEGKGDG